MGRDFEGGKSGEGDEVGWVGLQLTFLRGKSPGEGFKGWKSKLYSGFFMSIGWPLEFGVTIWMVSVWQEAGRTLSPA